jgi:hypothetical protein
MAASMAIVVQVSFIISSCNKPTMRRSNNVRRPYVKRAVHECRRRLSGLSLGREFMMSSRAGDRMLAASLIAFAAGLVGVGAASAQPGPAQPLPAPVEGDAPAPAVAACEQFARALRVSSAYYNNFAHSIAGEGARVDYLDPTVATANVDGRSALRKSAAEALSASGTPGLQPEIAAAMRAWSARAAKLLIIMGVQGNGDNLDNAATELNSSANEAQMACAKAGAQPLIRSQHQP